MEEPMPRRKYTSDFPEYRRAHANREKANAARRKHVRTPEQIEATRRYQKAYHDSHKEQAKELRKHPDRIKGDAIVKRRSRFRKYGLTIEEADTMFLKQDRCCAICKSPTNVNFRDWSTDHDHRTGKVRGILCHGCNTGLGGFRDSIECLRAAIAYLSK